MWEDCQNCERCNYRFNIRKPRSIQYALAWNIAALCMFIPANILPMMVVYSLGIREQSTILEGISHFIHEGMYPIALVIFTASILIPLGKIACLFLLIYVTKRRKKPDLKKMTKLYNVVAVLGPWSMLDIFVVAIMAAVVNLGFISSIEAASGITFFGLTVVFTMLASSSFDIRLLWDSHNNNEESD